MLFALVYWTANIFLLKGADITHKNEVRTNLNYLSEND